MLDLFSINPKDEDERHMLEALKEAKKAYQEGEVPIGAVLVYKGRVVAKGRNQVEILKDSTAHAEILCITSGSEFFENWRLSDSVMYCTLEPCCMCAGAMFLSRIKRLVWGAPDLRYGANGTFTDLFSMKHPIHNIEVRKGVLENECAAMMKGFFQKCRVAKKGGGSSFEKLIL